MEKGKGRIKDKRSRGLRQGRKARESDRGVWRECKAQISAELIIVIAALVAVAIVLVNQLQKSAKTGSDALEKKTKAAWDEVDKIK
jgi:hypothetical protein